MKHFLHYIFLGCIAFAGFAKSESKPVYILIHGTWAVRQAWHSPEGDFYKRLAQSIEVLNSDLITFTWSGKPNHDSRHEAGRELARVISRYSDDTEINIIAHSHGANVGIIASKHLGMNRKQKRIKRFYALGVPVDIKWYMPNMDVIEFFYNFFSLKDRIQPVLGLYSRLFTQHERIANVRLIVDGEEPSHSGIHCPIIGQWIPFIHEHLASYKLGNFKKFCFGNTSCVRFYSNRSPRYEPEVVSITEPTSTPTSYTEQVCQNF